MAQRVILVAAIVLTAAILIFSWYLHVDWVSIAYRVITAMCVILLVATFIVDVRETKRYKRRWRNRK